MCACGVCACVGERVCVCVCVGVAGAMARVDRVRLWMREARGGARERVRFCIPRSAERCALIAFGGVAPPGRRPAKRVRLDVGILPLVASCRVPPPGRGGRGAVPAAWGEPRSSGPLPVGHPRQRGVQAAPSGSRGASGGRLCCRCSAPRRGGVRSQPGGGCKSQVCCYAECGRVSRGSCWCAATAVRVREPRSVVCRSAVGFAWFACC